MDEIDFVQKNIPPVDLIEPCETVGWHDGRSRCLCLNYTGSDPLN